MDFPARHILKTHYGIDPIERKDVRWTVRLKALYPKLYAHLLEASEKEEAYVPPVSPLDTPEAHLQNLNHFSDWADVLGASCDQSREPLAYAFRVDEWVYAATPANALRLPLSFKPDCGVNDRAPEKMPDLFKHSPFQHKEWKPLSALGEFQEPKMKECPTCEGHGYNTLKLGNTHRAGDACPKCEGAGEVEDYPYLYLKSASGEELGVRSDVIYNWSFLPDFEWNEADDNRLYARFANGQGELIATRRVKETQED